MPNLMIYRFVYLYVHSDIPCSGGTLKSRFGSYLGSDITVRYEFRTMKGKEKTKIQKAILFYCACLMLYHLVSYSLSPELDYTAV